jgi:hypothetical protein
MPHKRSLKDHWVRWTRWEFWPAWLAVLPVYGMALLLALRAQRLFFFTNVNPAIPQSGVLGESKSDILKLLPARIVPATVLALPDEPFEAVLQKMQGAGIDFPVVAKPDVGERGFLIRVCPDAPALARHLKRYPTLFMIQPFLTLPEEYSVMFYRFPDGLDFGITSVCKKGFLEVTGDGRATVGELMAQSPRAAFQAPRLAKEAPELYNRVLAQGEKQVLEPIGNHARGTAFFDARHVVDESMVEAYRRIADEIEGVTIGRFDLKCASVDALRRGDIMVMEMNGVFGEPAHVYDPGFGFATVYRDYWQHLNLIYRLHRAQLARGIEPASWAEMREMVNSWYTYKKKLEAEF